MKKMPAHYLPKEDYQKAITQLRMQIGGVLANFDVYGLGVFIPGATDEIIKLAEDYGLRIRGVDKPISLEYVRRKKK